MQTDSQKTGDNKDIIGNLIIADDDPGVCASLSAFFNGEGFGVYICRSVSELMAIDVENIKAALIDLDVDGGNGLQIVELIRQRPVGMNTPIIVCSDVRSTDDIIKGLNAGADDYILKPYSTRELLNRVRALIHRFKA